MRTYQRDDLCVVDSQDSQVVRVSCVLRGQPVRSLLPTLSIVATLQDLMGLLVRTNLPGQVGDTNLEDSLTMH